MRFCCHGAPVTMCDGRIRLAWGCMACFDSGENTLRRIVLRFWDHMQSRHLSLFIVGSRAHFNCVELKCRSLYMRSCCHGAPLTMWSCRLYVGHMVDMLGVKLYSVFWQLLNYLRNREYVHEWSFNRIISKDLIKTLSRLWPTQRCWWQSLRFSFCLELYRVSDNLTLRTLSDRLVCLKTWRLPPPHFSSGFPFGLIPGVCLHSYGRPLRLYRSLYVLILTVSLWALSSGSCVLHRPRQKLPRIWPYSWADTDHDESEIQ